MRWGLIYSAICVVAIPWFVLDSWEGSRAVAASLLVGGALGLALSAAPRPARFGWAPPLLVFSTSATLVRGLYARLAELEEPGSTLGGSGTDAIVLLLIPLWVVAFAFTTASLLSRRRVTAEAESHGQPRV